MQFRTWLEQYNFEKYILEVSIAALEKGGVTTNPNTKCCHLDITTIYPTLEEAKREAILRSIQESRHIVAIYNFKQNQTVYL